MWINCLGVDDFVNNLYDESESGVLLLKVFERISPGSVDWKKVDNDDYYILFGIFRIVCRTSRLKSVDR